MKTSRVLLVLLAMLGVLAVAGCGGSESVPADAVAVLEGNEVTRAQLDALLERVEISYKAQKREFPKAGTSDYLNLQTTGTAFLVQRIQYALEAADRGITVTEADVDKKIAEIKKTHFSNNQKKFEQQLKETGYTVPTFTEDLRANLISERLYASLTKETKVTDADVKAYYAANKTQYVVPETRDVRHILVATKAEADKLYDELKGGADFAKLAKAKSTDTSSAVNGGKLTAARGQTVEAFDKTAFLLGTNVISRPVKTEFGYHIIQPLGAIKPGSTTPLSAVKASITSQLEGEKSEALVQTWLADLKKKYDSKVSYADGFAPPAALDQSVTAGTPTAPAP